MARLRSWVSLLPRLPSLIHPLSCHIGDALTPFILPFREGMFPEPSPTSLCSVVHEYSACVTSRNKPKCRAYRSRWPRGLNTPSTGIRWLAHSSYVLGRPPFYAGR